MTPVSGNYYILVAVSTTNDPTGTYYRYAWPFTSKPDYPKYGIWPDGYYLGVNSIGDDVCVLERSAMLTGTTADLVSFNNPNKPVPNNTTFNCVLPSDCDGPFPPVGTPNYFMAIGDDAWDAYSYDRVMVWEFHVEWTTPWNSTWTGPLSIATGAFDSQFNAFGVGEITQPGTTQVLDCIPWILMYRPQFRNFGTYWTLVCNHSVDVDATNHAGIRWYELRKYSGSWSIHQQGTYTPDDDSRWMGSIAMNGTGDIALGYSVSSTSTYPSIRFTGRLADDPLGTMTFDESSIYEGSNSQTDSRRWGDYSMMSVDPVNDYSFWYISEYAGDYGGTADWVTQVGAFAIDDYCYAGALDINYEYISNVSVGDINKGSGSTSYANFTALSTDLPINISIPITVTNGNPLSSNECGIWADWNRDGVFNSTTEKITVDNTPGSDPYTASIQPPEGTTPGPVRMRIRITYNTPPDPCGVITYGEVEDYTINVVGPAPNVWVGSFDNFWHNAGNWSFGYIPISTEDVVIPAAYTYFPKIHGASIYSASISNLLIESGAHLEINNGILTTYGNTDIHGSIELVNNLSELRVEGDIFWHSGSAATISGPSAEIYIKGLWEFMAGSAVHLDQGYVEFLGSQNAFIRSKSTDSYFYHVRLSKDAGYYLGHSGKSNQALAIHGNLYQYSGSIFTSYTSQSIILNGIFNNLGGFITLGNGTFIFNGNPAAIPLKPNVGDYFNNLTISGTSALNLGSDYSTVLDINGDLLIESGGFSPGGFTVQVGGNWTNNAGTAAFVEGSSRVIFNGPGHQYVLSDETFNILEANMGNALRPGNNTVTCNEYDWTTGGIDVDGGTFTALDLTDEGLFGGFWINPGGTINLYQDNDQFVDVNCILNFNGGGTINVFGGSEASYWPWAADATINMNGGVLNFDGPGIRIDNSTSWSLTTNITGGIIRTSNAFSGNRGDFQPTAGTFEFYGSSDPYISQSNECTLHNVLINKSAKAGSSSKAGDPVIDKRSGEVIAGGGKTNSVTLSSDFVITRDLEINSGTFNSNGFDIYVGGNWTNNAGPSAFTEGSESVIFNGSFEADILTDETFYDVVIDKSAATYEALELGSGLTLDVLNNLQILDGTFELNSNSTLIVGHDVSLATGSGLNAYGDIGLNIEVGGNWVNDNTGYNTIDGYTPGTETITFNGTTDQTISTNAPKEDFGNLVIDKSSGQFRPNNNIDVMGDLQIIDGQWSDNVLLLTHYFEGDFEVGPAGAYFTHVNPNTAVFKGTSDQNITYNSSSGYFYNVIVDKTDWTVKKSVEGGEIKENGSGNQSKGPKSTTVSLTTNLDMEFGDGITIDEGVLNLNGHSFTTMGDININNGGTLTVDENAVLKVDGGDALNVNSGGFLHIAGTPGNEAIITHRVTGAYDFNVKSGGNISAESGNISYTGSNGLWVNEDAIVDPTHAFNYCTFTDGTPGFAPLVVFNNDQVLICTGVDFPQTGVSEINAAKANNGGDVTFLDATGDFAGEEYEYDEYNRIHWTHSDIVLDLTVFLEGPFNTSTLLMDTDLNGQLPTLQPYGPTLPYYGNTEPDWYHTGLENVGGIPSSEIIDWVVVELRDATSVTSALPSTAVARKIAFLRSNGDVVDLDGFSLLSFLITISDNLYAVIWHRNHVGVISNALVNTGGSVTYDFSSGSGQAYGGASAHKLLGGGVWGMMSGDGDGDGNVTELDIQNVWYLHAGESGYNAADFNMDGEIENPDKDDQWLPNFGSGSFIPE